MTGLTNMFFGFVNLIADFVWLIVIVDLISILVLLFIERMDPRTFVAWLLIFIFLPFLGVVLYLFIGCTLYRKHIFTPKNINDQRLMDAYLSEMSSIEADAGAAELDPYVVTFAKTMKRGGAWGYSNNNDIELISMGTEKMESLFNDLRNARKFILFEYYIIRNDAVGNELMDILTEKVKEGVEVFLSTDAFGNGKGPKKGIRKFRKAGGKFATFHNPVYLLLSPKKNNRNHRKFAIIDGEIAYCGGFNIGNEYVGKGRFGRWRDSSVRIRGGGVLPLTIRFIGDWNYMCKSKHRIDDVSRYLTDAPYEHDGTERLQIVSGGPDTVENNPVKTQYMEIIRTARQHIFITTPYLGPDDCLFENLRNSAMSGVDVKVIIPAVGDHIFVHWNTLSTANELMKHGVRVFLYQNGFIHSKTMFSDGVYCSVGSANLDERSLRLNFETNAMIYSKRIHDELLAVFNEDLSNCTEYSCAEFDSMPFRYKVKTRISHFFKYIA